MSCLVQAFAFFGTTHPGHAQKPARASSVAVKLQKTFASFPYIAQR
jgi:hypothetical protein